MWRQEVQPYGATFSVAILATLMLRSQTGTIGVARIATKCGCLCDIISLCATNTKNKAADFAS